MPVLTHSSSSVPNCWNYFYVIKVVHICIFFLLQKFSVVRIERSRSLELMLITNPLPTVFPFAFRGAVAHPTPVVSLRKAPTCYVFWVLECLFPLILGLQFGQGHHFGVNSLLPWGFCKWMVLRVDPSSPGSLSSLGRSIALLACVTVSIILYHCPWSTV